MRISDIKVGYIYNVIFDPVKQCEFNGKHLAIVLKKNKDNKTYIVMPLTSSDRGNGIGKVEVGEIDSLPTSLSGNKSYAVYNQIRTVNADRFIALKEEDAVIECKLNDDIFNRLLVLGIRELVYSLKGDRKIEILKNAYEKECVEKAKDIAYDIIKMRKNKNVDKMVISELKTQIKDILKNISYSLEEKYINDGVKNIFDESIDK